MTKILLFPERTIYCQLPETINDISKKRRPLFSIAVVLGRSAPRWIRVEFMIGTARNISTAVKLLLVYLIFGEKRS
jgi:hypothetical protein